MPSPPPPYSAASAGTVAGARSSPTTFSTTFTPSPLSGDGQFSQRQSPSYTRAERRQNVPIRSTELGSASPSPLPNSGPSFPPPPSKGTRNRSSSRIGADDRRSFFSLSGLTSRSRATASIVTAPADHPMTQSSQTFAGNPPSARRASSTGDIGLARPSTVPAGPSDRSPLQGAPWEPGMPLPPPPPGPPPASRSQSVDRYSQQTADAADEARVKASIPRRSPSHGTALATIPPTPVEWTNDETFSRPMSPYRSLHIDTSYTDLPTFATNSRPESVTRSSVRRDGCIRGIRERRSESRAARENIEEPGSAADVVCDPRDVRADAAKPTNLILDSNGGTISRRRMETKTSPRSVHNVEQSIPRNDKRNDATQDASVLTPPYTPQIENGSGFSRHKRTELVNGHISMLQSSPRQHEDGQDLLRSLRSTTGVPVDRPISHILHAPIEGSPMPAPLSPSRPPSSYTPEGLRLSLQDAFVKSALERHRTFVEKEAVAQTDRERLELFVKFMVAESRIRRDKYSAVFDTIAGDIFDLSRDMWRSSIGNRHSAPTSTSTIHHAFDSTLALRQVPESSEATGPSSASSFTDLSGGSLEHSPAPDHSRIESNPWGDRFRPCLSPIPSMAMSTAPDGEDSRGRSSSRWWEESAGGSVGRGNGKLERSKKESKYMGLHPDSFRTSFAASLHQQSASPVAGPSTQKHVYGSDDYPPEKTEWQNESLPSPQALIDDEMYYTSAQVTPRSPRVDVSHLVTLPPPYPRHYPAVNNSHPSLAAISASHRDLIDLAGIRQSKERFHAEAMARKAQQHEYAVERRYRLRRSIGEQTQAGNLSFAGAARAEARFGAEEAVRTKDEAQEEFDAYQRVYSPLETQISDARETLTASASHLKELLAENGQENHDQTEGDEQPELLEKLTLLKWLFEAREQLHRELFVLENSRAERYQEVVLVPYRLAQNAQKIREVDAFFAHDAKERQLSFARERLQRTEALQKTIEGSVTRGVEAQLSAFWDIAPELLAVAQKIPYNLDNFEVLVPASELSENPAYGTHSLQYLFTLLIHAKKSTYQFIESQVNLLCLLHEIKTTAMHANVTRLIAQRCLSGQSIEVAEAEMRNIRHEEERLLTLDLQEKVGEVERQWEEALGRAIYECTGRVRVYLEESGGWDESLLE
ncbi:hypothetical protein LTR66_007766 [Elasticomyces elasticus]|nr:hypothetical protein LTR66_007766 [Elasticomyces elasticus]